MAREAETAKRKLNVEYIRSINSKVIKVKPLLNHSKRGRHGFGLPKSKRSRHSYSIEVAPFLRDVVGIVLSTTASTAAYLNKQGRFITKKEQATRGVQYFRACRL